MTLALRLTAVVSPVQSIYWCSGRWQFQVSDPHEKLVLLVMDFRFWSTDTRTNRSSTSSVILSTRAENNELDSGFHTNSINRTRTSIQHPETGWWISEITKHDHRERAQLSTPRGDEEEETPLTSIHLRGRDGRGSEEEDRWRRLWRDEEGGEGVHSCLEFRQTSITSLGKKERN